MTLTAQTMTIETFVSMLGNLSHCLEKGAEHAKAKGFDGAVLARARLAPDMYPLFQQVQVACFVAKSSLARLTGQEAPPLEASEETLDQLRGRIQATIEELRRVPAAAFEGAEERTIVLSPGPGIAFEMRGAEYVRDWALPQFYFHVVTAYAILRHNGVDIGKRDYVMSAGRYLRETPVGTPR